MNHDIEEGVVGLATIKKWALVAESFQPVATVSMDTARLQRQIEELSASSRTLRCVWYSNNGRQKLSSLRETIQKVLGVRRLKGTGVVYKASWGLYLTGATFSRGAQGLSSVVYCEDASHDGTHLAVC